MCDWTLASIATSSERAAAPLALGPVNEDRRTVQACPWTLSESGAHGVSGAAAPLVPGPVNEDRRTVQACPWTLSGAEAKGVSRAAAPLALGPGNEDRLKTSSTASSPAMWRTMN